MDGQNPFDTNLNISLSDIDEFIDFIDLEKLQIKYERIKKPDNVMSDYFLVHYKNLDTNPDVWNVKSSCLSKEFSVVNSNLVIDEIVRNLNSQISYRRDLTYKTFSRIDFILNGVSEITDAINRRTDIIFKMLTQISPQTINEQSKLSFTLLNAFGGEQALTIYYGFLTEYSYIDDNGQTVYSKMNNFCLLSEFSTKIIHNQTIEFNFSDIIDVKSRIVSNIERFYNIQINEEVMDLLKNKLPKKLYKSFMAIFENVPDDMKNLYYVSYILSFILKDEKSLFNLQKVSNIINYILSSNEQQDD